MTLVELALSRIGLTAPSQGYADAVSCNPRDNKHDLMLMSGCGLVVRKLWWDLGVHHPVLSNPYRVEYAIVDVIQIARDAGCLDKHGWEVGPGTVIILNNPVHVLTVVQVDGPLIVSVDGGQRTATRLETITRRSRYHVQGSLDGRPILHLIDGQGVVDVWNQTTDPPPCTARSGG